MFRDVFVNKQRERNIAGEKPRRIRGALGGELRVTRFSEFFLASVTAFLPDTSTAPCSHGTVSLSQRSHGARVCTAQEPEGRGGQGRSATGHLSVCCAVLCRGAPGPDRTEAEHDSAGLGKLQPPRVGRDGGLGAGMGTTVSLCPTGARSIVFSP